MVEWSGFRLFGRKKTKDGQTEMKAIEVGTNKPFRMAAGIPDIVKDTERLRSDSKYDNEFDLYDSMLLLDPELNGAVRAVSLTANNYEINYSKGKNGRIRNAIRELVEDRLDFDDLLINSMRNLMVYGNDVNKLVGSAGNGITDVQSLPVSQITIVDERGGLDTYFSADDDNPIINAVNYFLREGGRYQLMFPVDEILHFKIDYRSTWFTDNKGRRTYGIWGASRFSSLKQPIRAKYNTINNRIALEDAMTKQYITIDKSAIEHIQDPLEQKERLTHIMDEVISLFEGLRGDQIPVLPHYVQLHHVDLQNTIPNSAGFLDQVNADIAAVLQVPRVAAGQERGSTFAATYNANMWAVQAISRMHRVMTQTIMQLFSKHLKLLGIPHRTQDIPTISFEAMESETPMSVMQRVTMGYQAGILTLNQALTDLNLPEIGKDGNERKAETPTPDANTGETPRENSQPGKGDVVDE
jgi:hypothetical protein